MKHFPLNPLSWGSADDTKHAVQVHAPEDPLVSNKLELYKRD